MNLVPLVGAAMLLPVILMVMRIASPAGHMNMLMALKVPPLILL
jgi:hypothetical protein